MKKKPSQNEIDVYYDNLPCKIFDLQIINNNKYYLDKDLNIIWDSSLQVAGVYKNKKIYFFDDKIINDIILECNKIILL